MAGKKKTVSSSRNKSRGDSRSFRDKVHVITPEDSEVSGDEMAMQDASAPRVWIPGMELGADEVLEPDMSVYEMLHEYQMEWPCLSFDLLPASAEGESFDYPMSIGLVAGSQADRADRNKIFLMNWSNLGKNQEKEKEKDNEEDDSDAEAESGEGASSDRANEPKCHMRSVSHAEGAGINRIRTLKLSNAGSLPLIVSTWSERGRVYVWDLSSAQRELQGEIDLGMKANPAATNLSLKPVYIQTNHRTEGYAMDWSSLEWGNLLTGDCNGQIYLTQLNSGSGVGSSAREAFTGHSGSVEDLQWSPDESTVFASCSTDKTVRIWDVRCNPRRPALSVHCHDVDVNVMSWNRRVGYLLATGADDGTFKTWDLRTFGSAQAESFEATLAAPVAEFRWHCGPITSIQWHPTESSVLAVSGADDQISLWDFAVERDSEAEEVGDMAAGGAGSRPIPPHLLFSHHGQREIKEIHWHPRNSGVMISTALTGFNIFKTISV